MKGIHLHESRIKNYGGFKFSTSKYESFLEKMSAFSVLKKTDYKSGYNK